MKIATNDAVTREELLEFLRPRHHAIVITARRDGRPEASPVACGVDAEGRIVISTYPERAKANNARRNEQVSVIVLSDDWNGPWVQVDGDAEVLGPAGGARTLVEYFRCISGEHPDWDEYRAAMIRQGKSLLRITPTRWGPVADRRLPGQTGLTDRLLRFRPDAGRPARAGGRFLRPVSVVGGPGGVAVFVGSGREDQGGDDDRHRQGRADQEGQAHALKEGDGRRRAVGRRDLGPRAHDGDHEGGADRAGDLLRSAQDRAGVGVERRRDGPRPRVNTG